MKTLRFGIELETVGLDKEGAARAIAAVVGGTARPAWNSAWEAVGADERVWRAVHDGSLSGYLNAEIVSPVLAYEDIEKLQEVVRALHAAGARADASCGIHIHIDGSRFDAKELTSLTKIIHKQERLIEAALGIQPHRLSRYCRPIDPAFIERLESRRPRTVADVNAAWYGRQVSSPARYDQSRYHGVNLNSYFYRKTIEFRYFEGTTHAGKVKAYLQFCLALASKALGAKSASSRRREYNPATAKYDFRVFLLSLGLIGDEFKTARLHLLARLGGSAAWKGERRDRRPPRTSPEEHPAAMTA
jgi:hypothetical protein